ncbi:4786_t:CDS:1 [Cetraspora pellucida]|uniref:4786_t:CDS:1 n=1 Tax=Cetraspora pellucida TaxID=1433469 RepID=A0ACA9MNX1_9GLOM|nr:4786_t:CDS:1 [Cetraspora pellucida]
MQEIQNNKSGNNFALIEQLQGPNCFNYKIQQYSSKKAEYCQGIRIAKKEVQLALDTDTMNEFIGLIYSFIESKSIASNNSLDDFRIVTNPHIILHHGRSKKQLQDFLDNINRPGSQKILESNKVLCKSDITNKSTHKCSYCNNTSHYAKTCSLNPNNKR